MAVPVLITRRSQVQILPPLLRAPHDSEGLSSSQTGSLGDSGSPVGGVPAASPWPSGGRLAALGQREHRARVAVPHHVPGPGTVWAGDIE
jgi:hypothetical protein